MTGVTTGQTALPTATDSDDNENFLTVSLTAALQAVANLFDSATGHDHSGSGKGKPIASAGIATGVTLTTPTISGTLGGTLTLGTNPLTFPGQSGGVAKTLAWGEAGAGLTSILGNTVGGAPTSCVLRFDIANGTTGGSATALTLRGDGAVLAPTMAGQVNFTGTSIGFFNHSASAQQATAATATDLASVITLANALKTALTNLGLTT